VSSDWGTGFTASLTVTNGSSAITGWTVTYTYSGNQQLTDGWSGNWSQSGETITVTSASFNGSLAAGASTQLGANFNYSGTNSAPSSVTCTPAGSSTSPPPTTPPPSSPGYLYENSGQWAQYSTGGYTIYNDEWGSGYGSQTLWVNSATNWGVFSTQPSTSGVKSYANISKSIGTALNSLSSATSSFNESNPSSGNWESAYDIWLNGSGIEVMAWTDVSGNVGPLGSSVGTVSLDGNTWTLYAGNNGSNPTYSFVRSGNETSGTVNILDLLKYLENTKDYFSNPTLSTIQYGWEISGTNNTQEDFTINNYSASAS
ncbi:MAG TPA: cellulose binding domain-containing protein, partial [Pseudonocardiaceae bacterium]|nr:cellulose binding domain-containing protein [Pseudonocardiaceae bacterium]